MKIEAATRLALGKEDKEDAERYRAIRDTVLTKGNLTLKAPKDKKAFDNMIDKVLRE